MKQQAIAHLFYRELLKIQQNQSINEKEKIEALYRLLNLLFIEVTQQERLQFTTLFARIAFACQKYQIDRRTQFFIHAFRKEATKQMQSQLQPSSPEVLVRDYQLGLKVLADSISALLDTPITEEVAKILPQYLNYQFSPVKVAKFIPKARVVVLGDDYQTEQLIVRDEQNPTDEIRVQYNISYRNENFNPTVDAIRHIFGFPVNVNLIDIEVDSKGIYRPKAMVIEPDYLVDVSAVSECFQPTGAESLFYLMKKYLPFHTSIPLMIGNIANFFLDELMTNPDATFMEIFPKVFRLNPLAFCMMDDREIRQIMQKCQKHYVTLKSMVHQEFQKFQIQPKNCFLEPSFYSETYGLQGRLDIFYKETSRQLAVNSGQLTVGSNGQQQKSSGKLQGKAAIVELKSGKPFMANRHGISQNHYTQTLLYDLIIRSVFEDKIDPANYILYSGQDMRQLRYAPVTKAQQYEAIQIRNQLVSLERQLSHLNFATEKNIGGAALKGSALNQGNKLFRKLSTNRFPKVRGFLQTDLQSFEKVYSNMSPLERKYFIAFSGFIAREHQLAKTGVQGMSNVNGLAALWLSAYDEKWSNFDIISFLKIKSNNTKADEPIIIFEKTEKTNPLANFRKGDIAVLYPHQAIDHTQSAGSIDNSVLTNQIFKCTIIDITKTEVFIRLRYRQFNTSIFEENEFWHIEHDMLDMGFNTMYKALYAFAQFPSEKKELLLTLRPPNKPDQKQLNAPTELTQEQQQIFKKIINANDYFLLWGPPGTGKTSMMLKNLVGYLLNNTDEHLMLLAYTNRAVDEICEAIDNLKTYQTPDGKKAIRDSYLRIGSRYSTASRFQQQLLTAKTSKVKTRKELIAIIQNHRIFVGTVASIANKPELLKLKTFHRVIIDEASQILEPNLVGFLPHFKRFILIGDHKQLPAVVVQDANTSQADDADLQSIGLHNLRNSFFERLYKRCIQKGWDWAYAQLSHQGRMHQDIMDFPNRFFYESSLNILPQSIAFHKKQIAEIAYKTNSSSSALQQQVLQKRMIFMPTAVDYLGTTSKTNKHEAQKIGDLVVCFQKIYQFNDKILTKKSIGIITPYRAQIAQIQEVLREREVDLDLLTIDTVERYQGGARDIILISLCTNSATQLESLVSLSDEGVDRKLNVALTRAREHLVILGNPRLLRGNKIYEALIGYCGR